MGLRHDFMLEYGLLVKGVYLRVGINYADAKKCSYHFDLFYDADNGERKKMQTITSGEFVFTPKLDGDNLIKQAYQHAKGIASLKGVVDEI